MSGSAEQTDGTAVPAQRGRHAAPRTPVRVRLRGRALAMAAVPTALLMAAAYTPNPAVAESAAGKPCGNAPVAVPDVAPIETPVPKSELPEPPPGPSPVPTGAPTAGPTAGPSTGPTAVPTQAPTQAPTAPTAEQPTSPVKPPPAGTSAGTPAAVAPTTQVPAARSAATGDDAVASGAVQPGAGSGPGMATQAGLIDDIVGGINHLLNPTASPSPTQTRTPAPGPATTAPATTPATTPAQSPAQPQAAAATPAATPTAARPSPGAPSPAATPSGKASPKATPSAGASGTASPTAGATGTPSATPTDNPNCAVDARSLTAGAAASGHVVPEQNWTLQTSRLALHGATFHGVYDVKTPTGSKRVLKFVVDSVDIDNLDMSTLQGNGVTFHVQGAKGSTSTMRNGPVTMYVERLSGHLSKVLGLPIPIDLGEITLTPDTLPRWLYDLIGSIPIPLDLELTGVTAKQAGQFGGTLHIPGMHLFNDDAPYSDK
ncbi:hypothetical protein [Kitasatospora sp. NPDC086791]|uniref:hypothetical protein n=1 Tax=Kitasatospora sp. NPDC086791 TaxID=3155178 RepID=UPI003444DE8D